jgi:hypothetical protein
MVKAHIVVAVPTLTFLINLLMGFCDPPKAKFEKYHGQGWVSQPGGVPGVSLLS